RGRRNPQPPVPRRRPGRVRLGALHRAARRPDPGRGAAARTPPAAPAGHPGQPLGDGVEVLRAQDNHVGLYVAQGWGDGEWVNVEIGMYTLGHTPGHTPYYEKILARHLDNCDKRRHHRRTRPALDELRVLTWEGDSREPEEHT